MNNQLYPIGTQLIMRRLSQAALCAEILGEKEFQSYCSEHDCWEMSLWIGDLWARNFIKWRITVTVENQAWLSPRFLMADFVKAIQSSCAGCSYTRDDDNIDRLHEIWPFARIVEREYPNGQRAPLIQFDEVILPEDVA